MVDVEICLKRAVHVQILFILFGLAALVYLSLMGFSASAMLEPAPRTRNLRDVKQRQLMAELYAGAKDVNQLLFRKTFSKRSLNRNILAAKKYLATTATLGHRGDDSVVKSKEKKSLRVGVGQSLRGQGNHDEEDNEIAAEALERDFEGKIRMDEEETNQATAEGEAADDAEAEIRL